MGIALFLCIYTCMYVCVYTRPIVVWGTLHSKKGVSLRIDLLQKRTSTEFKNMLLQRKPKGLAGLSY